jgi:hypothetical protein
VEREEFDGDGNLICTMYQNPIVSDEGTFYRVCSGSYTVIGSVTSLDISQASTFTPRSMSSFFRRGLTRLVPTLPSMRESLEYTLLSSSDDEGDDPKSSFRVKQEVVDGMDVGVPYT